MNAKPFSTYELSELEREGRIVKVVKAADVPAGPHFQILRLESVVAYSGYEAESGVGAAQPYWTILVLQDRDLWLDLLQRHAEAEAEAASTNRWRTPDVLVGIVCQGRAQAKVSISVSVDVGVPQ